MAKSFFPSAFNKEIKMRPNLSSGKIRLRDAQYPAPQKAPHPVRSHSSHLLQIHQGQPILRRAIIQTQYLTHRSRAKNGRTKNYKNNNRKDEAHLQKERRTRAKA